MYGSGAVAGHRAAARGRMRPGTRAHLVAKLAGAGMWAAVIPTWVLVDAPPGWRRAAAPAGAAAMTNDGPAGQAAHRWHALAAKSRLMLLSAGRRWLSETESLLAEVTPARRGTAPQLPAVRAPAGGKDAGTAIPYPGARISRSAGSGWRDCPRARLPCQGWRPERRMTHRRPLRCPPPGRHRSTQCPVSTLPGQ